MTPDAPRQAEIVYPDSDGEPMADNTLQWDWMVKIVGELRELFAGQEVFVAGNLLWYPVEGDPKTRIAPDALVAFGRPPGYRGSYKQWEEGGGVPQVVFEVLSPSNTDDEMDDKLLAYERFGVDEYYVLDPYANTVEGHRRRQSRLINVRQMNGYVSPKLGVRFGIADGEVKLFTPDGREFRTREERVQEIWEELRKTALAFEEERERAIAEMRRADDAELKAAEAFRRLAEAQERAADANRKIADEFERSRAERMMKEQLMTKLRELGVNPDDVLKPTG